jgi:predicted TPR repeat methyltransferase
MRRIPDAMLAEMAAHVSEHDRDEMAIPSYRHPNLLMRWMAWRRVEVVAKRLRELTARQGRARTLMDFGCGTGVLLDEASRAADRVIGVDLVTEPAALLSQRWQLDVELMHPDEARKRVRPGSIDVIVAAEVLEHVEPVADALDFFAVWLKPGGRLLVSLPTENRLYRLGRSLAGFHGHYHHANAASIDRAIVDAGFQRRARTRVPLPGPLAIYWVVDYVWPYHQDHEHFDQ